MAKFSSPTSVDFDAQRGWVTLRMMPSEWSIADGVMKATLDQSTAREVRDGLAHVMSTEHKRMPWFTKLDDGTYTMHLDPLMGFARPERMTLEDLISLRSQLNSMQLTEDDVTTTPKAELRAWVKQGTSIMRRLEEALADE